MIQVQVRIHIDAAGLLKIQTDTLRREDTTKEEKVIAKFYEAWLLDGHRKAAEAMGAILTETQVKRRRAKSAKANDA